MAMTWVWTGMVVLSLLFGLGTGRLDAVAAAALSGAGSAVELSLSMAGVLCLWSGVMEVMKVCGLSDRWPGPSGPFCGGCCPRPAGMVKHWRRSPPTSRPICWGLATRPLPWGFGRPAEWPGAARGWPATSFVCWWCSTPPPFSCSRPPSPPSAPQPAAAPPSTFCRRCGFPPRSPLRPG